MEVFKLTWIDLQKLIWMNFKATFLTFAVKMHIFFWILIFFSVLSCLGWLTNWVFSITAEKVTQNWSLSLLISQPLLFNKYFYCKIGIYPPDRVSDNSEKVVFLNKKSGIFFFYSRFQLVTLRQYEKLIFQATAIFSSISWVFRRSAMYLDVLYNIVA